MRRLAILLMLTSVSTGCTQKCGVAVASEDGNAVFTWTCPRIDAIEVVAEEAPEELLWRAWSADEPLESPLAYGVIAEGSSMQEASSPTELNKETFYRVTIFDCRDGEAGEQDCRNDGWGSATFEWVD